MSQTITINDTTYRLIPETSGDLKIVFLQRGNVLVGRLSREGDMCTLRDAEVIRRWGTTQGIGEIALNGPTGNTVLDPCGTVTFHVLTSVMVIDCDESKW